jgi:hypothetical protein
MRLSVLALIANVVCAPMPATTTETAVMAETTGLTKNEKIALTAAGAAVLKY